MMHHKFVGKKIFRPFKGGKKKKRTIYEGLIVAFDEEKGSNKPILVAVYKDGDIETDYVDELKEYIREAGQETDEQIYEELLAYDIKSAIENLTHDEEHLRKFLNENCRSCVTAEQTVQHFLKILKVDTRDDWVLKVPKLSHHRAIEDVHLHEAIEQQQHQAFEAQQHHSIEQQQHHSIEAQQHQADEVQQHEAIEQQQHDAVVMEEEQQHHSIEQQQHHSIEQQQHQAFEGQQHHSIEVQQHNSIEEQQHQADEAQQQHQADEVQQHQAIEDQQHDVVVEHMHHVMEEQQHEAFLEQHLLAMQEQEQLKDREVMQTGHGLHIYVRSDLFPARDQNKSCKCEYCHKDTIWMCVTCCVHNAALIVAVCKKHMDVHNGVALEMKKETIDSGKGFFTEYWLL